MKWEQRCWSSKSPNFPIYTIVSDFKTKRKRKFSVWAMNGTSRTWAHEHNTVRWVVVGLFLEMAGSLQWSSCIPSSHLLVRKIIRNQSKWERMAPWRKIIGLCGTDKVLDPAAHVLTKLPVLDGFTLIPESHLPRSSMCVLLWYLYVNVFSNIFKILKF